MDAVEAAVAVNTPPNAPPGREDGVEVLMEEDDEGITISDVEKERENAESITPLSVVVAAEREDNGKQEEGEKENEEDADQINRDAGVSSQAAVVQQHDQQPQRDRCITAPPPCAWARDITLPTTRLKEFGVSLRDGFKLLGLGLRMRTFVNEERAAGRDPFIDPFLNPVNRPNKGIPLGGIGGGCITRGWKGDFNTFQLLTSRAETRRVLGNQFSLYVKRYPSSTSTPSSPLPSEESIAVVLARPEAFAYEGARDSVRAKNNKQLSSANLTSKMPDIIIKTEKNDQTAADDSNNKDEVVVGMGIKARAHVPPAAKKTVPSGRPPLSAWGWSRAIKGTYAALFPRAWTLYNLDEIDTNLKLTCRQVSPVIPHNYKESSYPVALFVFEVENTSSSSAVDVSLMQSWHNGTGHIQRDQAGGHYNRAFEEQGTEHRRHIKGVKLVHKLTTPHKDLDGKGGFLIDLLSFGIGTRDCGGVMSDMHFFETSSDGADVWNAFAADGTLGGSRCGYHSSTSLPGVTIGGAVANKVCLQPGEKRTVEFAVGWDMPVGRFGSGRGHYRRYTKFYGKEGNCITQMVCDALHNYPQWEKDIWEWQKPIIEDASLPDWYTCMLFNELYYLTGGGTLWTNGEESEKERLSKFREEMPLPSAPLGPHGGGEQNGKEAVSKKVLGAADGAEEKKVAYQVINDYLQFSSAEKVKEGVMLFRGSNHTNGKVVFDLKDLELHQLYTSLRGLTVERVTEDEVLLDGRIPISIGSSSSSVTKPAESEPATSSLTPAAAIDTASATPLNGADSERNEGRHNTEESATTDMNTNVETERLRSKGKEEAVADDDDREEHDGYRSRLPPREVSLLDRSNDPYGQFAYLEGLEYLMYNTYDVHFYASWALVMLFPQLQLSLQRDVAAAVLHHAPEDKRVTLANNQLAPRKIRGAVPHDLGLPSGDPWHCVNGYIIHDLNHWKDLNSKFILQTYRDFIVTKDLEFLKELWDIAWEAMVYLIQFDKDRDGMIENEGFPDQTYDTWSAEGVSAYSGGLWVAALQAMSEMAQKLKIPQQKDFVDEYLARARSAYDVLWNGKYYEYDNSKSLQHNSVMADMMAGQWYARACHMDKGVVARDRAISSLNCIYDLNVCGFGDGNMGAVNGMRPYGMVDQSCMQSSEVWTGTTFGLAACMIHEDLIRPAFKTASGIFKCVYRDLGYWFQTPEAWDAQGNFRSLSYMRPLAVWGMQWAIESKKKAHRWTPPAAVAETSATVAAVLLGDREGVFRGKKEGGGRRDEQAQVASQ